MYRFLVGDHSSQTTENFDSEQASVLDKLPPELMLHLFSYMNDQELANLRLVNRLWCELSTSIFDSLYEKSYRSRLLATAENVSTKVASYLFNKKIERFAESKWRTNSSSMRPSLLNYMKPASPSVTLIPLSGNRFIAANEAGMRQLSFELHYCAQAKQLSVIHPLAQFDRVDSGQLQMVRCTDSHVLNVGREDKVYTLHLMNQESLAKIGTLEFVDFSLSTVCLKKDALWIGSNTGMVRKYLIKENGFERDKREFQAKGRVNWLEWIENERLLLVHTPGCLSIFSESNKSIHMSIDVLGIPFLVSNHLVWRESTKEVKAISLNALAKEIFETITIKKEEVDSLISLGKSILIQLNGGWVEMMNEKFDPIFAVQIEEHVKCAVQKGSILALGTAEGKVYIYDLSNAQSMDLQSQARLLTTLTYPQHGDIESLSFSDTSILMITTSLGKSLCAMPFSLSFK